MSPSLIMPSLFSAVASHDRVISTCITHCKHWFWDKLALVTIMSTSTIAVDNLPICTNGLLFFVEFLSFCLNEPPSQSYRMSLAMWDQSIPAIRYKWTHCVLTPARQAGTRFTYSWKAELTYIYCGWPVTYWDGLSAHRRSPIPVVNRIHDLLITHLTP